VRNGVLHRGKEESKIINAIRRRKTKRIRHILRRNCIPKHVIDGKIAGRRDRAGRRER